MKINDKNIKVIIEKTISDLNIAFGAVSRESCDRSIKQAIVRLETLKDMIDWE